MRLSGSLSYYMIDGYKKLFAANASIKRIEQFMKLDEFLKDNHFCHFTSPCIEMNALSSSWKNKDGRKHNDFGLRRLNLVARGNHLIAVIGRTGSGKTALLLAILEEMKQCKMCQSFVNSSLKVEGKVFFVSQEPWIYPDTIKNNILFGQPYNQEKYDEIIRVCSLQPDLQNQPQRDETMCFQNGRNLSGGQRARISMARALYADADIYLFDDSLSAVDVRVANQLMNCIMVYLQSKIRILALSSYTQLRNFDKIIYMDNGRIAFDGSYQNLGDFLRVNNTQEWDRLREVENIDRSEPSTSRSVIEESAAISSHLNVRISQVPETERNERGVQLTINDDALEERHLIEQPNQRDDDEDENRSNVPWSIYYTYLNGFFGIFFTFLIYLAAQACVAASDYWVAEWASKEEEDFISKQNCLKRFGYLSNGTKTNLSLNTTNCDWLLKNNTSVERLPEFENRNFYLLIYSTLVLAVLVMVVVRLLVFGYSSKKVANKLHKKMFETVIHCKLTFFKNVGRINNRFQRDINQLDQEIPIEMLDLIIISLVVVSALVISIIVSYLVIVPLLPLAVIFVLIRRYYMSSALVIKRLDLKVRGLLNSHLLKTVTGLTTIRSCNNEGLLDLEYHSLINSLTKVQSSYIFAGKWLAIRLDWIANFFAIIVLIGSIFLKDYFGITPGQVGVMIVYIIQITCFAQWCAWQSCEVENLMTSAERINQYINMEVENFRDGTVPERDWPNRGQINFVNVTFKYDENLPRTLINMSFVINSGEKIGIIGRTGAGKTSICQALFRLGYQEAGRIIIDGIDISTIKLNDLRSRITIIPQEPVLFEGTTRYNLDPLKLFNDAILMEAVRRVGLENIIRDLNQKVPTLSLGQKQLFCLAKALIRRSNILIIDEVTANVDTENELLIRNLIRNTFSDSTVITIAHRLQTIADCGRIMGLNSGELQEFDTPRALRDRENSLFNRMLAEYSAEERQMIDKIIYQDR